MTNLLITKIVWETINNALAASLPQKVLILSVPDTWGEEDICELLEHQIGCGAIDYAAVDANSKVNEKLDHVVVIHA